MKRNSKPKKKNVELLNRFLKKNGKRDIRTDKLGIADKKLG